jgi:hypothetical protein
MSEIPFNRDPVFWIVLGVLTILWLAGYCLAWRNDWATPGQMTDGKRGINWVGHFGFWSLLIVVQPALAWATAKMWPLWVGRGDWIAACIVLGLIIGAFLQSWWSYQAGSSDAWSTGGFPNHVGIIHIIQKGPEIGIMLMLFVSFFWFGNMPFPMFLGILLFIANHFLLGLTHWPLHWWYPDWRPEGMNVPLSPQLLKLYAAATASMLLIGFGLIAS